MAIKYECPKCGRKFTEWGAEKLGFKCPHDAFCPADAPDDIELVRAGAGEDQMPKRSSLKRKPVRKPVAAPVAAVPHDDDDDADEVEVDEPETPDAVEGESDEGEEETLTEDADDVDDAEEDEDEEEDAAPGALPDAEDFDALPPTATPSNPLVPTDEDEWN